MIGIDAIRAARERIRPHVRLTPVLRFEGEVWLKLEQLQHTGSFKARGGANRIFAVDAAALQAGVVTASGGNHGLAVAWAARLRQAPTTVYLPERAPLSTEARLVELGARVTRHGRDWDDAWALARQHKQNEGGLLVHPFEDDEVIAGQGTIGLEMLEQLERVDIALVAVGGGGLIAGVGCALKTLSPSTRVIGVEPSGAPTMLTSLTRGHLAPLERVDTIASTLAPRSVGPNTLALTQKYVDEVLLVSDDEMRTAMQRLWAEARVLVEPAGAAAMAALMSGQVSVPDGARVAVLCCGANLDAAMAATALG